MNHLSGHDPHATAPAGAGGFWPTCRGAVFAGLLVAGAATAQQQQPGVPVPSGQAVVLSEVLIDETPGEAGNETWVRFRFVAPRIARAGGDVTYDTAAGDMDALCREFALPYLAEYALSPARVVISLSDRPVPFGAPDPDATAYFEAYRLENDTCIWEQF